MVQLAEHILDTKAAHFHASKFKDRYETALKAPVKRKAAGKKIEVVEARPKPDKVVNLMEALQQSLASDKRHSQKGKTIPKKRTQCQRRAA